MPRLTRLLGLLLMAALVLPSLGADDNDFKKKDDPPKQKEAANKEAANDGEDTPKKKGTAKTKEPGDKEKKDKFTWGAELVGRIQVDGNSQRGFTLHVTQKIMEPDYGAQQQYAQQQMQLAQQQARMATARTLQERNQAALQYYQTAVQLAQTQQRLFRPRDFNYDVKLRFAEDMKVRLLQPPVNYDDKGNLKKYTSKELQELRGKEGLPGFKAEMDAVHSGQIVTVFLAKKQASSDQKDRTKPAEKAGAEKEGKKKAADNEDAGQARPRAVMILILKDVLPSQ